jgi:O-antigen/teichoic acid export membrane protein
MNVSSADEREPGYGLPLRNFGLSLTSKAVSLAAHLAFVMLTARLFSKQEVAVIALTGIVTIIMDVSKGFGLGTILLKRLPQMGESEKAGSQTLIRTYLAYSLFPPLLLTLLGLAAPSHLMWNELGVHGYGGALKWGLLASLFIVLSNTNILVLQASQKFGHLAMLTLLTAASQRLVPCLAAVWLKTDLEQFLLWSVYAAVLGFVATCVPLVTMLRPFGLRLLAWHEFWPESRHFYGTSLLRYGATQVDQLFVAVLFPPATLAVYYMLRRLYSLGVVLIGSMIDALVPELAQQAGVDPKRARGRLTEWSRLSLFAGSAGAALMAGNGSAVIELLLGPGYGEDPVLIALFAGTTSLYFVYCFVQVDLLLFQAPERVLWMAAATAGANLLAGPLTSPWLGVHSIPLAMLAGYLLGLMAARHHGWSGTPPRQVWRFRELGAGLAVVTISSLAPVLAHHAALGDFAQVALVNLVICSLLAVQFWRYRVGESLRRLSQRAA